MSAPRLGRVAARPFPGRPGRPRRSAPAPTPAPRIRSAVTIEPTAPRRLLTLRDAAAYLGLSTWTVRALEAQGALPRVRVPLPRGGELRKVLFDRADLDAAVARWKA